MCRRDEVLAWMGAANRPAAFEVGDEVRQDVLLRSIPMLLRRFFNTRRDKMVADIYLLARIRLNHAGVPRSTAAGAAPSRKRTASFPTAATGVTGAMASLIWLE